MIIQVGNINSKITGSISYQESLNEKLFKNFSKEIISVSEKKNKILRILHIVWTILRNIKKTKLVIIHSFSTKAFYITFLTALLCRLMRIKYFVLVHGGNYPARIQSSPAFVKMIFSYSSKNLSPSKYLQFHFSKLGYVFDFVPNAIDLSLFKFKERVNFKPNLLWVRAFDTIYNPQMAVFVVSLLKLNFPDVKLWMVGFKCDHSYEDTIELIKKLDLNDNIIITGVLTHSMWAKLSTEADLFINTTNIDNMPVSVLQAMALGLPVFSTNVGGIEWLIEDNENGIKCNVGDAEFMANKIKWYLENQTELKRIATNAVNIPREYEWAKVLPLWGELIKNYI